MSLPSGTDWESAVLKCATKLIDQLQVGDVGTRALKMMGANGPRIFQDMRTHLLMGNPADATLVFSEFAWKTLADNATSQNELVQVLQAISKNSAYGRAIAAGAGTCGINYKEALKVTLKGFADKAFPIGTCLAGIGWQGGLQARAMLNNMLVKNLYDKWLNYGDSIFEYGASRGQDGVIGYVAATMPPGKNPYQITDTDRAVATTLLKTTFAKWQAAQANAAALNLRPTLLALKARYQSLAASDKQAIAAYAGENPSEADAFWSYVQLMQRTRARLAPYARYINDDDLNFYSEQAVLALATNGSNGQNAWKQAIATDLQRWDPSNFSGEPKVCSTPVTPVVTGQTFVAEKGDAKSWSDIIVTIGNLASLTSTDSPGWRNNGTTFVATGTGSGIVPVSIKISAAANVSYFDYNTTVSVKSSSGKTSLSKAETIPLAGGSLSYTVNWDTAADPGGLSISVTTLGGNPDFFKYFVTGSISSPSK